MDIPRTLPVWTPPTTTFCLGPLRADGTLPFRTTHHAACTAPAPHTTTDPTAVDGPAVKPRAQQLDVCRRLPTRGILPSVPATPHLPRLPAMPRSARHSLGLTATTLLPPRPALRGWLYRHVALPTRALTLPLPHTCIRTGSRSPPVREQHVRHTASTTNDAQRCLHRVGTNRTLPLWVLLPPTCVFPLG